MSKRRRKPVSNILAYIRSPAYRQQVERDRKKYHRPSEPHKVIDPRHE